MDKGRDEMKVKLYYQKESLGREDRERLPFAFEGHGVLSVRQLIKLIRDYLIGLRRS